MSNSDTDNTFSSFVMDMNQYETELKANVPELILAFLTSAGISYYMGDAVDICAKRGGVQVLAQYIGGFIGDALQAGGYVSSSTTLVAYKVLIAGSSFVVISKQFGSVLPYTELLGESVSASLIGHYGGSYLQNWWNGSSNNSSNNSSNTNSSSSSSSASSGTPTY